MKHLARQMTWVDLINGMMAEVHLGNVHMQRDGDLALFCYTKQCVYQREWNPINVLARGLIVDVAREQIVATPFPKFFNLSEYPVSLPSLPFEAHEKLDGSLIIIFWHDGKWRTATKGSFNSDQAVAARRFLTATATFDLIPGATYLAEYVGPSNRIVVPYDKDELAMLAAYDQNGEEMGRDQLECAGWRLAAPQQCQSIADLAEMAKHLPSDQEGWVLRFENGLRIKIKGEEYCRLHRMVSGITPLAIWDQARVGADLDAVRKELPEEFWADFDQIRKLLHWAEVGMVVKIERTAAEWRHASDKELGLKLHQIDADVRRFVFPFRKYGDPRVGKTRQAFFLSFRPTGNRLDGYTPSSSINRVLEEAA